MPQFISVSVRKTLNSPSPSVYIITIASSIDGKASTMSASRMMIESTAPPRYPAVTPSTAPITMLSSVGTIPTIKETRDP